MPLPSATSATSAPHAQVLKPPARFTTSIDTPTVFIAGSIEQGTASDWQIELTDRLAKKDVLFLNPRRDHWDPSWRQHRDEPHFREQVLWELAAQERSDIIAMYFDPNTRSPVTLLELGLFAKTGKLIVCCPDGFWRKGNVDLTCNRYGIRMVSSLSELADEVSTAIDRVAVEKQELRDALTQASKKRLTSFSHLEGRVGIFGGTSDPPHEGHIALAQEMKRLHKLDAVVFIPTKQNPLKSSGPIASDEQRFTLTALAIRNHPGMFVSDIQSRLPSPSYTINMIRAIQTENGGRAQFFTLCAADIIESLHKWKDVAALNALAPFLVGTRPGTSISESSFTELDPEVSRHVRQGLTEIHSKKASSTDLREALRQNASPQALQGLGLDPLAARYIRELGIYGPA